MSNILSLKNISVISPAASYLSWREVFVNAIKKNNKRHEHYILKDVNLEINDGDSYALIGRNGAGKTTLARLLAGIVEPTSGILTETSHIRYVSDLVPGIDNNLSGLENAEYITQVLYSDSKYDNQQLQKVFKEAMEFTELGEQLDHPLRTYSLGMTKRLFGAVQTMLPADLIVLDEFSLGTDIFFLEKMDQRLKELIKKSNALVMINHSEEELNKFCKNAILIENGQITLNSSLEKVLEKYRTQN